MNEELTDWFPHEVKPVRTGWYRVRNNPTGGLNWRHRKYLVGTKRYWNGLHWLTEFPGGRISVFGQHPAHQWCGLKKDPQTKTMKEVYESLRRKAMKDRY